MRRVLMAALLFSFPSAGLAEMITITFDQVNPPQGVLNGHGSFAIDGYALTPTQGNANGYILAGSFQPEGNSEGNQVLVNNGTPNLMVANWVNLNLAAVNGAAFDLASLELGGTFDQEKVGRWSWASAVNIVGHHASGVGDSTLRYELDSDFALHLVTLNWSGLSSVDFLPEVSRHEGGPGTNDYEFTLDNFAVSAVPEPASWIIVLSGLAAAALLKSRTLCR